MALSRLAKIIIGIVTALAVYNGVVTVPVMLARRSESGVAMVAYRRWLIDPTTAVVDIWHVDGERSMADIDRNLFITAEALKGQSFSRVELAYRGSGRFLIDGAKFKEVGEEWQTQSIAYLMRAIPQAASKMDGQPAFGEWTGGFLGVMMQEMKDHNQLHWSWYLASMSGGDPDSPIPDHSAPTSGM